MKHGGSIFTIGIILVLAPFLGFPTAWKNFFIMASGLWLCGLVLSRLKRHSNKKAFHKKEFQPRPPTESSVEKGASPEIRKDATFLNTHDQPPTV